MSRKEEITTIVLTEYNIELSFKKAYSAWWYPDYFSVENLRLTSTGFMQIKKIIPVYEFSFIPDNSVNEQLSLSNLEIPFYVGNKKIFIFGESLACMIKLYPTFNRYLEVIGKPQL